MRKTLVALAVVVALLIGADFGFRALAQFWVAGQLEKSLELEHRPDVSLGGFPFLTRLVTGRFPVVTVRVTGAVSGGRFPLSSLDLTLRRVRFASDQLLFGNKATIRAGSGSGTAVLTERDLNRAFPATIPVTIRLADGHVRVRVEGQPQEVETRLRISGNELVLVPVQGSLPVEVRVTLPTFVSGLTYTDVQVDGSLARVRFRLREPRILVK